jgi:protein ImuB
MRQEGAKDASIPLRRLDFDPAPSPYLTLSPPYTNMCSMIACALIPRLSLLSALGNRREMLGRPVALAPEPGGVQVIGEPSGAAEAFGVQAGMRLSEALARCPALILAPPDPGRADAVWEAALRRLEGIGAAVEPGCPGEAFFAVDGLLGLYGGRAERVLARARKVLGSPSRLGAGPSRLCAYAAASRSRPRRPSQIVAADAAGAMLASLPVGVLRHRLAGEWERVNLLEILERLGVRTLGELAALPATAVADRFGECGLRALRMARGVEEPLRPRSPSEDLAERIELPEAASGTQLERALELLVERLLANPVRRGRRLRRLRLEIRLAGGGGWRVEAALRSASADAELLRLALAPKLERLPGPATELGLRALELGSRAHDQAPLARSPAQERRGKIGRRCAKLAPRWGATPSCVWSRSIPTPGCPSAGRC